MKNTNIALSVLFTFAACGQPPTEEARPNSGAASQLAAGPSTALAPQGAHPWAAEMDDDVPVEKFTGGAKAFADVRDAILKNYYAEGLTEDDVYRAATAGMLERLEPRMKQYNRLLSPSEIAEIKNDLKGEVVGVGVQIQFDEKSGYADVLGTFASSPSEKAGILAGDKIVTVNGKLYKGMRLKDVVADIRGKAGEPVTLSVLRGDKLVSFTVVRGRVSYDSPTQAMLADKLGYLRVPSFTDKTPGAVRSSLADLEKAGALALVVDLRRNPGGSFDRAIETAELLLPEGTPIVSLKRRGKDDEMHVVGPRAAGDKVVLGDVPLTVLVDQGTSSSAEFLAAALHESGRHARLVGGRTHGKWSVQSLDDSPNGFAYKYTVSLFKTPSGKSYEGVGVTPDVELVMDEAAFAKANAAKPDERLSIDAQLRTAKELMLR